MASGGHVLSLCRRISPKYFLLRGLERLHWPNYSTYLFNDRHRNVGWVRHGHIHTCSRQFCNDSSTQEQHLPLPNSARRRPFTVSLDCQTKAQDSSIKQSQSIEGPPLEYFLANSRSTDGSDDIQTNGSQQIKDESYIKVEDITFSGSDRKVYFETYGCQMNVSDTEVAWSIIKDKGFHKTQDIRESDVVLVMTCSIREGAEQKIWNRLEYLKHLKKTRAKHKPPFKIGILGCMAERLKTRLLEKEKMVDLVCGPDAYRDLPRMLAVTQAGRTAVNVQLSLEETYADVVPVRLSHNSPSAFVSIMRGCDNMCTYCIVPFTRGRERSRPITSILDEVKALSDQGIKEVTLLGQNVNSYRDTSEATSYGGIDVTNTSMSMTEGFKTVYKPKVGGRRFSDLLDKVSAVDPEMRIRFTSPHPKDFPDEVLYLIRDRGNVCNQLHLPAQSGSTRMLEAMRRGYTREAYVNLVQHVRDIIPDVSLSSDFIAGFCGETEQDHIDTVALMRDVKYNFAFCFPYSMRQKTHAFHRLVDDVSDDVKSRRHMELIGVFREEAEKLHTAMIAQRQLVLVEGVSKRSESELACRNEGNVKVIIPRTEIPSSSGSPSSCKMAPGDYVVAQITGGTSQVLKGTGLYHTTLQDHSGRDSAQMGAEVGQP